MEDRLEKHHTATVFVITQARPRKVLMLYHRKFDNWMPPGGHQESWENAYETAIREVTEETGLDVAAHLGDIIPIDHASFVPTPSYVLEARINAWGDQPEHFHLDSIYVVNVPEQPVESEYGDESKIGWFTLEQTEDLPTFENVRVILRKELAE